MSRENVQPLKKQCEMFSELMLMKFKPKVRPASPSSPKNDTSQHQSVNANQIKFLEQASKDSVIIGNSTQIDMINIDGLAHGFVDTFYYWSLRVGSPILDIKVSIKRELFLILTRRSILLYGYSTLKREQTQPTSLGSFEVSEDVLFVQFPTSDLIALFFQKHFEIYSLNDSFHLSKKLNKAYGVEERFTLFAVPQAIDHTIKIFFEQKQEKKKTFGLWCIQVLPLSETIKINPMYKIYDIMLSLRKVLMLQNYSKDIVFLNLGQEILVAKKGYIVDSVTINIQVESSYLKYLPRRKVLVHIEKDSVDLYSFKINLTTVPHRIQLNALDSIAIPKHRSGTHLIALLPFLDRNFALFYHETSRPYTRGEIFYSFVVSYTVELGQKVGKVLQASVETLTEGEIEVKCEALRKMGLTDQQIYLEIWRRSSRSTVKDFQFILATRDYKTIKGEIEAKLKKQSMNFKEVFKIEESCLSILKPKIEGETCNEELLKDYLTCSLFLRKLTLHRDLYLLRPQPQDKAFSINIQEYWTLKNMELKTFVLQHLTLFLAGKGSALELRTILHHFRFAYRYIYFDLLAQIVAASKNHLRKVLEALPELLPIEPSKVGQQAIQEALQRGIWGPIGQEEWESGEYLQKIANVNNRQAVEDLMEGLWFKRNWLTAHDFIAKPTSEIQRTTGSSICDQVFYFFIDCIFKTIKDSAVLKSVLSFLEKTYQQLPQHLCNKIMLYCRLYDYHCAHWEAARCKHYSFAQFLRLRDFQLMREFFAMEKGRKNSLLKQIKPIYEEICGAKGFGIFIEGLLSYFRWEESQLSNLKHLLNRINNEKKEFHIQHEPMYEVLIRAMQYQLRLGSSTDTPIEEVLIYIENIPISRDNPRMIHELELIQKISQESLLFRRMKINMTIREIIDNYETVVERLVDFKIKEHKVMSLDSEAVLSKTYRILAEVQSVKEKIYGADYNELAFFIYLTRLLQKAEKIQIAKDILNDEHLNNYYFIDTKIVESLVHYMYRWNFSQNPAFPPGAAYVAQLVQLLPPDNSLRQYLQHELHFALLLSTPTVPVTYPIVSDSPFPRVSDLEEILRGVDDKHIVDIDIEAVAEAMRKMEELSHGLSELNRSSLINKSGFASEQVEEGTVIRTFIHVLLSRKLIREVIPIIRKWIGQSERAEAMETLAMLYRLTSDLNEESKSTLVEIASYLYKQPLQLVDLVQKLITTKFTGLQIIQFLHRELQSIKESQSINFNEKSPVFNIYFTHLYQDPIKKNKRALVRSTLFKLKKAKPQFQHECIYDFIFVILCHQPHNVGVFLRHVRPPKWRHIRSFVNCLIQQQIFDQLNVLETFRRVFSFLLLSFKHKIDIYRLASQPAAQNLQEEFKVPQSDQQLSEFEKKIEKNAAAFLKKKNKMMALDRSLDHKPSNIDKKAQNREVKQYQEDHKEKSADENILSDSEDNYQHEDDDEREQAKVVRIQNRGVNFDAKQERKNFIRKDQQASIEVRKASPQTLLPNKYLRQPDEFNEFARQMQKNTSKMKKYISQDVRAGYGNDPNSIQDEFIPVHPKSPQRKRSKSPQSASPKIGKKDELIKAKTSPNESPFEHQLKRHKSKQAERLDQFAQQLLNEDEQDLPILAIQNKASERQNLGKKTASQKESNPDSILKKLYKTYDEKNDTDPYNIKVLYTEKSKSSNKEYVDLFKEIAKKIYDKPDKTLQIAFKLLTQMGRAFPQLRINVQNATIFQKIAKFQTKYGLQIPITQILPFQALYLTSTTPEQLFAFTKNAIMEVCDDDNIFKLSKLISIGFKKNAIEQQIVLLYLQKSIKRLNQIENIQELDRGLEKIKGVISKIPVRILVEKTEGLIDHCTHFDLRRKLVVLFVDSIRIKGNGKDAKQLANKLK